MSTFDVIMNQRRTNLNNIIAQQNIQGVDAKSMLPPELERQYQVFIVHGPNAKKQIQKMRDIKSH